MKKLRTIILIAGILVAGLAFNSMAQGKSEKTKPAKELKASKHDKHSDKHKLKEHKAKIKPHNKYKAHKDKHKMKADVKKSRYWASGTRN